MKVKIFNGDGTVATCPHGASICYPTEKLQRIKVGDSLCNNCPCHCETKYSPVFAYVECRYGEKK